MGALETVGMRLQTFALELLALFDPDVTEGLVRHGSGGGYRLEARFSSRGDGDEG
jgi:hypothetical protein